MLFTAEGLKAIAYGVGIWLVGIPFNRSFKSSCFAPDASKRPALQAGLLAAYLPIAWATVKGLDYINIPGHLHLSATTLGCAAALIADGLAFSFFLPKVYDFKGDGVAKAGGFILTAVGLTLGAAVWMRA